jgi:hypothetical protein
MLLGKWLPEAHKRVRKWDREAGEAKKKKKKGRTDEQVTSEQLDLKPMEDFQENVKCVS